MHWDNVLLLAILAIYVPWHSAARVRDLLDGRPLSSSGRIYLYLSTIAFQWIAAAALFWRPRALQLSIAHLGLALPFPRRAAIAAALISALNVVNPVFGLRRIAGLPPTQRGILALLSQHLLPRSSTKSVIAFPLLLTVAICEEFIYRAFAQTVLQDAIGESILVGVFGSAAVFSIAHLYQDMRVIITSVVVEVILAVVRFWTGSLLSSIIIHFSGDMRPGIAALRLLTDNLGPVFT